jgi:hypothetical protein
VFTPGRIAVLKVLASQAAISLENSRLYRDLEQREAKIRRLVDANIVGISIWNFEGKIIEANEAFLRMLGFSHEDVLSGHLRWTDLTRVEWLNLNEQAVAELKATGICQPFNDLEDHLVPLLWGSVRHEQPPYSKVGLGAQSFGDQGVGCLSDTVVDKTIEALVTHNISKPERLPQGQVDLLIRSPLRPAIASRQGIGQVDVPAARTRQ